MLTPSQLLAVASDVALRWRRTADALDEAMAGYLAESGALSQDLQGALRTSGGLVPALLRRLAGLSPETERMVRSAVTSALAASARSDAAAVSGALAALSEADQRAIGNSAEAVVSQIMSLARRDNLSMVEDARRTYVGVVSRYVPQVQRGTMSSERAVAEAMRELAERGVCVVDYSSGRREQPDVAIRRHVQTQVGQVAATRTMEACERLGVELVEVSSHTGARPSHRRWQGRVFSLHGTVTVGGVTYRDLREATGYGDPGGLCGVNCRNSFAPYVPGRPRRWSETPDEDEGLDPEEHYRATQRQRAIERKIREAKREAAADRAAGVDDTDARLRLGRAQAEMRQLLKDGGGTLDRQPARERAFGEDGRPVSARGLSKDPRASERERAERERERKKSEAAGLARKRISGGELPLSVKEGDQGKHVRGHNNFDPTRGEIDGGMEAARALVRRYHGRGEVHAHVDKDGNLSAREVCQAEGRIGVWRDRSGREAPTDRLTIHYSKRGAHVVPAKPSKEFQNGSH